MTGRSPRWPLLWTAAAIGLGLAVAYAALVRSMLDDRPTLLLACMDVEAPWHAWTCKQVLRHAEPTAEEVAELNGHGGALFPVLLSDPHEAEEMLALFLGWGVDIDAGDREAQNLTALHSMASEGNAARVALLLRHGARADVRTTGGLTPLDFARRQQARYPEDSAPAEVIRLLEAAGSRAH